MAQHKKSTTSNSRTIIKQSNRMQSYINSSSWAVNSVTLKRGIFGIKQCYIKYSESAEKQIPTGLVPYWEVSVLGGNLKKAVTFGTKCFVRYSWHVCCLGCPLSGGCRNSNLSKSATSNSGTSHRATLILCNMKKCNIKQCNIKQLNNKTAQHHTVKHQNSAALNSAT